ncbi:MAG: penicillin-binding protein 2 [Spirochaetes bacterium]|nr:MAG: penicillin-binding protein 2 [Spirochaetota bacterium]
MNSQSYKPRIIVLLFIVIVLMILYTSYLFNLQVLNMLKYQNRARDVSMRLIPIPAQRGEIYDRNMDIPLVINVDSFAVNIIPGELDNNTLESTLDKLSDVLRVEYGELRKRIPSSYRKLYQPVELKSNVDLRTITYIAEHKNEFPGITWNSKPIRNYTCPGSITHVLGYVGNITVEEYQVLYNKGYTMNSQIGKSGVEKEYDSLLRGKDGKIIRTVDVKGRKIESGKMDDIPPTNGKTLVLTIDRHVQKLAEEALGERMGSVVVLKPATGEILALVSYPWFDPNVFYTEEAKDYYRKLALDPRHPFLNRTIQSAYAPASTFKIIMTTADIEEKDFPVDKTITCNGYIRLGDRIFKCHKKEGHGSLILHEALEQSCDVYFYTLGLEYLGIDTISDYARRFGYGNYTEIDLPGEIRGLVPTPSWKEEVYNSKWVGGDTVNTSIGQGYLNVTPIQMADMVALTVNKGVVYKPHVLKAVLDPVTGKIIQEIKPEVLITPSISRKTLDTVQEYMRGVVTDGTAKVVITTKAVEVAGKTGTGEVGLEDRWNAWFAANGPYGAPPEDQVVVLTMVEATNKWEWWAVRAANIIFQGLFAGETYDEAIDSLHWGWLRNKREVQ